MRTLRAGLPLFAFHAAIAQRNFYPQTIPKTKKVIPARFERATDCLEGSCSIQLSYGT